MKILKRHEQSEIRESRDAIYKYILANPVSPDKLEIFDDAISALCKISCICGLWDKPFED